MKSWYITVLNGCNQLEQIKCLSVKMAEEKLAMVKEKYINNPSDPTAPRYTFHRELY